MTTNIIDDFDSENEDLSEEKDEEMEGFHEVDEVDGDEDDDIVVKKIDLSDKIDDDDDDDMAKNDW